MDRLACVQYLCDNGVAGSEWQEAGMWDAVQDVMSASLSAFDDTDEGVRRWLDALIERARNN